MFVRYKLWRGVDLWHGCQKVAQKLGKQKMSARAVGHAIGQNPIAIIIPCHRVVGANGALTGYAWGLERKIKLLELEKANKKLP